MHIPVYQHTTFKQSLWHKDSQHLLNFRCCTSGRYATPTFLAKPLRHTN